jgi:hypothetical protein
VRSFPSKKAERASVSDETLHLIHRVIRHGDRVSPGGRQLSFLDVSFATLRTETISAIYELFLSLELNGEKSDDGAFYTPPFLVDYVLDEIDRVSPFGRASRVLDPAAGSSFWLARSGGCSSALCRTALGHRVTTARLESFLRKAFSVSSAARRPRTSVGSASI